MTAKENPIAKVDASDELNKKLHDFVTEVLNAPIAKIASFFEVINNSYPRTPIHGTITNYNNILEMDVNYNILQGKVKELNDLGVDITLKEIADIIESKFLGEPAQADLRRNDKGELLHPCYTVLRYPK